MEKPDSRWLSKDRHDRRAGDRITLRDGDAVVLFSGPTMMRFVMLDPEGARPLGESAAFIDANARLLEGLSVG